MIHYYDNCILSSAYWEVKTYIVAEEIIWKDEAQTAVFRQNRGKSIFEYLLLKGAFYDKDYYAPDEKVLILYSKKRSEKNENPTVALIISEDFFNEISGGDATYGIDFLKNLLKLPSATQKQILSFAQSGRINEEFHIEKPLFGVNREEYYKMIQNYLTPQQKNAYERWRLSTGDTRINDAKKMQYILNISPVSPYRKEKDVSYESIIKVFDKYIPRQTEKKKQIARILFEKQQKKERGMSILLYGLNESEKKLWIKAISNALNLPKHSINFSGISSSLSIVGCESSYTQAQASPILLFMSDYHTSEVIIRGENIDMAIEENTGGKDSNVIQSMMPMLNKENPVLKDNYLDGVEISMKNTVFIFTASSLENVDPSIRNLIDYKIEIPPYSEEELIEMVTKRAAELAKEKNLNDKWINSQAKAEVIKYRSDFGSESVIQYLDLLASYSKNNDCKVTRIIVKKQLEKIVDMNDPKVNFHLNKESYSESKKKRILELLAEREQGDKLTQLERRILDRKIKVLVNLIPGKSEELNVETIMKHIKEKIYVDENRILPLMSELYAVDSDKNTGILPLLLAGPPGTGKTSVLQQYAQGSGKEFIKISMNGLTREKLRGNNLEEGIIFRKLAEKKSLKVVLLLDEIDKCPPQLWEDLIELTDDRRIWYDHFTDYSEDLKDVQIICTTNSLELPSPLLSRFNIVHVKGYSNSEKIKILEYLIPEVIGKRRILVDNAARQLLLDYHSTEVGVRALKQDLQRVVNQIAFLRRKESGAITISEEDVMLVLGKKTVIHIENENMPGKANALGVIGDRGIVIPIAVKKLSNNRRRITGKVRDDIRESILIAESLIEEKYNVSFEGMHLDMGHYCGYEKSGNSCGVPIYISMLSCIMNVPVKSDCAMTGAISLDARVHPVGGVHTKLLAAESTGLKTVYLPEACRNDIDEEDYRINIRFVSTLDEIVAELLPSLSKTEMHKK